MFDNNRDFFKRAALVDQQYPVEMNYWLNKLAGSPGKSVFPYDNPGAENAGMKKETFTFPFKEPTLSKLIRMSNGSDAQLHMILVAAVAALIHHRTYPGNTDIIIGIPIYRQETDGPFSNTVLPIRILLKPRTTFKELILHVRQNLVEAVEHQKYPIEKLADKLNLSTGNDDFPLFDVAVVLEGIHFKKYIRHIKLNMVFSFLKTGDSLEVTLEYNALLYSRSTIVGLAGHLENLLEQALTQLNRSVCRLDILAKEEKQRLLEDFNGTPAPYPAGETLHRLVEEQVGKTPDSIAVVGMAQVHTGTKNRFSASDSPKHTIHFTYRELNKKANQLAHYLIHQKNTPLDGRVGVLMRRGPDLIPALLGILKTGSAYIPIDSTLPRERIKIIIRDARVEVVISQKNHIQVLNCLQWECSSFHTYLCMDSWQVHGEEETDKNQLMDEKLWDYVGETAVDEITGGGWMTSYTGEPFSPVEMEEYGQNVLQKLTPFLGKDINVLEIGCASGITMYRIAPGVGTYYGTDLSPVIIEKNKRRTLQEGHRNIRLAALPAHEIHKLKEQEFHIVIINSVIQAFHGCNYLRQVIGKAIDLIGKKGHLFIGDVMDLDLKKDLIREMTAFKQKEANLDKDYRTKTDFSAELFVSRAFFKDLALENSAIREVEFSEKIHTIENELTKFRYDCLITVDKTGETQENKHLKHQRKCKFQHDLTHLEKAEVEDPAVPVTPGNLAYLIYTSGTSGRPKGVLIGHKGVVNLLYSHRQVFGEGRGTRVSQVANPGFDAMAFEIWPGLTSGAAVYIADDETRMDPAGLKEWLIRNQITNSFQPTHMAEYLLAEEWQQGVALEVLPAAGDRLTRRPPKSCPFKLYNLYGPTEDTVWTTWAKILPLEGEERNPPIGKPVSNHRVYITGVNWQLLPINVPGELCIAGPGLARGYLNHPELTAEKFKRAVNSHSSLVISSSLKTNDRSKTLFPNDRYSHSPNDRFYRTGDLARWLPDGNIEFLGRIDQQVKIRGFRIEPVEIETHLLAIDPVREAVVVDRQKKSGEKYLCVYIVAEKTVDITEIREILQNRLPAYMIPAFFLQVETLPLTANGKIDKNALPEPVPTTSDGDHAAPRTRVQEKLVVLWAEILGLEKQVISIDSNFFHLGGHSLKATILMARMDRELHVKVPLERIFKTPNIKDLAAYIEDVTREKAGSIKEVEAKEYYGVSSAQKRLFILNKVEGVNTTNYNMPTIMLIKTGFDQGRLENTFKKLIRRHEALRTSFSIIKERPVQIIHHKVEFTLDYRRCTEKEAKEKVGEFIRPFDLNNPLLLRVGLLDTGAGKHILMVDMHHIIADGVAMELLVKEFKGLYQGKQLPGLKLQYKSFSGWQNNLINQGRIKRQEEYWLDRFKEKTPPLDMPTDYPRPPVRSTKGNIIFFQLSNQLTAATKKFVAETNTTLNMVLLAVYNILLAKCALQEEIIVGTPVSGRNHPDLMNIIGTFANILAMKNNPRGDKTFQAFLQEVKKNALDAYENQDYQYEELLMKLEIPFSPDRNPLFDAMLNMVNVELAEDQINPAENQDNMLVMEPYALQLYSSKCDLLLRVRDNPHQVAMSLEYSADLFKQATVESISKHFIEILKQAIENKELKLGDITLSTGFTVVKTTEKREKVGFNF